MENNNKKQSSRYVMRSAKKKNRRPFIYDNPYEDFVCERGETFSPATSKGVTRPNETELVAINLHEQAAHAAAYGTSGSSLPHPQELHFTSTVLRNYHRRRKFFRWMKQSTRSWAICFVFLLFMSVLVVSMGWKRRQAVGSNVNLASGQERAPPASLLAMADYLVRVGAAQTDHLQDHTTPQYYAAEWLTQVDQALLPENDENDYTLITRYALAVHFFSFNGVKWTSMVGFLKPQEHVCTWQGTVIAYGQERNLGVFCDDHNKIPQLLRLNHNELQGQIPTEVALLTTLTEYNVHANSLVGTIPLELCQLTHLKRLRIDDNDMMGTLPVCLATALPELEYLYVADNLFTGTLPFELSALSTLRHVVVGENNFSGDPLGIFEAMKQVEWIFAENNNFFGPIFRHFLKEHEQLVHLDISGNAFTLDQYFPHHLFSMPALLTLDVGDNLLEGVIEATISTQANNPALFTTLQHASLAHNKLRGPLPPYMEHLQNLQHLDISNNFFTGDMPTLLGSLQQLQFLSAANNPFRVGLVPGEFAQWRHIVDLNLRNTYRAGHLPEFLSINNRNMTFVDLGQNQFTGPIPPSFGDIPTRLQMLFLNDNDMTGTIPYSFSKLQELENLFVQGNHRLTGDVSFLCDALPRRDELFVDCHVPCACCECCPGLALPEECAGSSREQLRAEREALARKPYYGYYEDDTN